MITRPAVGRLTSGFGMRDGVLHDGQDIGAPAGTRIVAAWDGVVSIAGSFPDGWGNLCVIDHGLRLGPRMFTRYAHMLHMPEVRPGQTVQAGQPIGLVGSTGKSTGPHLHFGVYKGDVPNYSTAVNPAPYFKEREDFIMALDAMRGCDYSKARPTKAQLDANGLAFAIRYILSPAKDSGKRFTPQEAALLTSWGRRMVCNYEYEIGAMAQGRAKGIEHAREALVEMKLHRVPLGRPCYFSDDTGDTPSSAVLAYLGGVSSVLTPAGYATGIYGGLGSITAAYNAGYRWLWQTYAWSDPNHDGVTTWHPGATIRQVRNGAFPGQFDGDLDTAMAVDFGQWDTTGWTPTGTVEDDMDGDTYIIGTAEIDIPGDTLGRDFSIVNKKFNWWLSAIRSDVMGGSIASAKAATAEVVRDAAEAVRDAGQLAAITALADVVKAGGGNVDSAAIIAAIREGQSTMMDEVGSKAKMTLDRIQSAYVAAAAGMGQS